MAGKTATLFLGHLTIYLTIHLVFWTQFSSANTCDGVPFDVSTTVLDGDINQIAWIKSAIGLGGLSGFALTSNRSVWRSDDAGASWTNVNDEFQYFNETPNHFCVGICVGAVEFFPTSDNSALFITGLGGRLWVVRGDTNSYESTFNPDLLYHHLFPHPTNRAVVAATHVTPCCWNGPADQCNTCVVSLSVSDNFGVSWTQIESYVPIQTTGVVWGHTTISERDEDDGEFAVAAYLLYAHFLTKTGDQRRMRVATSRTAVVRISDYRFPFTTSTVVLDGGYSLFWGAKTLFAVKTSEMDTMSVSLFSSNDGRSFKPEVIPAAPDSGNVFSSDIVDILPVHVLPDGRVFLYVERRSLGLFGNDIYVYDTSLASGLNAQFSFSSLHDIDEIVSARSPIGTYRSLFANRMPTRDAVGAETILSFDGGKTWLEPRASLLQGMNCSTNTSFLIDGTCLFHFAGTASAMHHFADAALSGGLMLATGNLGRQLSADHMDMAAYLSRDAGFSWKMIREGSHLAAMSVGAEVMILMKDAPDGTNEFVASFDSGSKWTECKLGANESEVSPNLFVPAGVITDPSDSVPRFLLIGAVPSTLVDADAPPPMKRNVIMHLQFKPESKDVANCSFPEDFEPMIIPGVEGCEHGRKLSIMRRKANSNCRDENSTSLHLSWETCECTLQDFVCDDCFRDVAGVCYYARTLCPQHELATLFSCTGTVVSNYTGYKRDPLTTCQGGLDQTKGSRIYACSEIVTPPPPRPFPVVDPSTPASRGQAQEGQVAPAFIVIGVIFGIIALVFIVAASVTGYFKCLKSVRERLVKNELGVAGDDKPPAYVPNPGENPFLPDTSVPPQLEMS